MSELLHFIQDQEAAFRSQNRLASLYSEFSAQKTLNSSGYAANLSAWKKALFHACRKGKIPAVAAAADAKATKRRKIENNEDERAESSVTDHLSFSTGEELARALELRPYGRPTGLTEVIKDAVEKKELIPLKEYLHQQESVYSSRWLPTPWEVVRWGLRSLGLGILYGQNSNLAAGRFVVLENVELAAQEILEQQRVLASSSTAGIYSLATFTNTFEHVLGKDCVLSTSDIQVVLRFMSRDKPSLTYDAENETIKFASTQADKPATIEASDVSIAQVKSLQLSLTRAIPPLEARYTELDARVRDAVVKKQTSAAKSFLKARKMVETTLEQRRANLLQVQESLNAIDNAANNVALVTAMQESTKVMRDLNARVGGIEGVERVTDALREEMDTAEDIGRIVAEPGAEAVDEGEVEEEFEALLAAEKTKEEAAKEEERKKQAEAEEKERLKHLEEEEMKEKLRRLEEWEKFQQAAKEAEEKKAAEERAAKEDLESRFAELQKPHNARATEEEKVESVVESTREGVKEMSLVDNGQQKGAENKNEEQEKELVPAA